MNGTGLPDHVRDFIIRHITSLEQLTILLLFANDPAKKWTIPQLVNEIRSSTESVSKRVRQLQEDGFLTEEKASYRFTAPPEKSVAVMKLAAIYRIYPTRVIDSIYNRTNALKNFSDAFKFKPKE